MVIGKKIKNRRIQLNMSQEELAFKMGYKSRSTIAKIESGINKLSKNKLNKLCKFLYVDLDYFDEYSDDKIELNNNVNVKKIAIILAGGKSTRNNLGIPNQFISVLNKPILAYTLDVYQNNPSINAIYIVCHKEWISYVTDYLNKNMYSKIKSIIPAGESGTESIKNSLENINCNDNDIIIFQEATRPMVNANIISKIINYCNETSVAFRKTDDRIHFLVKNNNYEYIDRNNLILIESPEAYRYKIIKNIFGIALEKKHPLLESCVSMLMYNLGFFPRLVEINTNNLKIITQEDVSIFETILKKNYKIY